MATVEEFKVKVTASGLDNLDKVAAGAENAAARINGLATAILGVGFGAFIFGAMEMADRISDLSDATGISIGAIKGFEDALGAAGGKSRNAEKAILGFVSAIETANDGSLKVRDAFAAVGVSLTDLQNLSESELLMKTVDGLSRMEEGSARTATQATLLTKAFRGVDAKKFFDEFEKGKISSAELAEQIKLAGERVDEMERNFKKLQEGALIAMDPILKAFGETEITAKSAATGIQILGIAMGVALGAGMIANIATVVKLMTEMNVAAKAQAAIQTFITALQGPKGLLLIAGATAAAGAGYLALNEVMKDYQDNVDKTKKVEEEAAAETARLAKKYPAGGVTDDKAGRAQVLDARQKAYIESDKRIAQSRSEADKSAATTSFNEIANIRLNAENDITKAIADIKSKEYLSDGKKNEEIAAKRLEINAKAEAEIRKIRETNARELQLQAQSIAIMNNEKAFALAIDEKSIGLGTNKQKQLRDEMALLNTQSRTMVEIDNNTKLSDAEKIAAKITLNSEYGLGIQLIQQEFDQRQKLDASFSAGAAERIKGIQESFSNFKTSGMMVDSVFNNMGSSLDRFVETGKLSFGDLARSILIDLEKIALKSAVVGMFKSAGLESLFIPGRAAGGPVSAGSPYIVGEKGPELFIPQMSGSIIPNGSSGGSGMGGGTTIINNISAIDAKSVAQLFAENRMTLFGNVEQARRELPMRTR